MRFPSVVRLTLLSALAAVLFLLPAGCGGNSGTAELVLLNGRIATLDSGRPEADALASSDGRITALGSDDEIRPLIGPETEVIDLEGKLAIPGFIDAHGHLEGLGAALAGLDAGQPDSWQAIVDQVAEAVRNAEPGAWIVGRGWHQEKWIRPPDPAVEGFPINTALNRVSPDNPVLLVHASGHAAIANARALEAAGIDRSTADPSGGRFVRDHDGSLTGVLQETAEEPVAAALNAYRAERMPEEIEAEAERTVERAVRECLSRGVTGFQDAGSGFDTVDRYRRMAEGGRLGIRVWVMLNESNEVLEERIGEYRTIGAHDHHLTVRAVKRLIDGALGSRGAWLLEPYSDQADATGMNTIDLAELEETARIAADHGLQLCVHAIGDRGNREVLDLYERILGEHPDGKELRWRVEHAQHLHPDDIGRFASLGVIASMQGIHCTSDGPWVLQRLGEQRAGEGAYAWRSLIDAGAVICNGTDTPVESVDPIANFHALVTRRMADGSQFHPEQAMTREEALRASTCNAAYAAFSEDVTGSLAVGKYADITVLSRDILRVPEEEIPGTEVVFTIVGGKVLYRK